MDTMTRNCNTGSSAQQLHHFELEEDKLQIAKNRPDS